MLYSLLSTLTLNNTPYIPINHDERSEYKVHLHDQIKTQNATTAGTPSRRPQRSGAEAPLV